MGFGAVLFEGNIDFYGKSGFAYASKFGIRYHDLPEDADSSFFLCKELIPGYLDDVTADGTFQSVGGFFERSEGSGCIACECSHCPRTDIERLAARYWRKNFFSAIINMTYSCRVGFDMIHTEREREARL